MGEAGPLRGGLSRRDCTFCANAEAAHLCADRSHHRGTDHLVARGARRKPELGLSLLLGPGRHLHVVGTPRAGSYAGGRGLQALHRARNGRARRRPADRLRVLWRAPADRAGAERPGGIPGVAPGARWQWRRRSEAARCLRRTAGSSAPLEACGEPDQPGQLALPLEPGRGRLHEVEGTRPRSWEMRGGFVTSCTRR